MKKLVDQLTSEISCDTLLIPVAPLSPYPELPLGVLGKVTESLVEGLTLGANVLAAPLVSYGFITPYKGQVGTIGMRRNSFPTLIADTLLSSVTWGVKRALFLVPTDEDAQLVREGYKRYKRKLPEDFRVLIITWQTLPEVKKYLGTVFSDLHEHWRSEASVGLLADEILALPISSSRKGCPLSEKDFQRWYKRGMDPEKLQKIAPDGAFSSWNNVTTNAGFAQIVQDEITKKITRFLENV